MNMTVAAPPATKIPQFINGQWIESHASEWLDVVNPATAEVLGQGAALPSSVPEDPASGDLAVLTHRLLASGS